MSIALDATYSVGPNLSGVGVYSRQVMFGLARAHPEERFQFCYRSQRLLRSFRDALPPNASRRLLRGAPRADLFHALNQRVDARAGRTVATFHDLFVITGDYSTPEFRARFSAQARQAAALSDLVIAISRFTAAQVEALLGVEASRIRVIPHGATGPPGPPGPPRRPDAPREKLVLFVGAIQRRKNVARLVRAFERLPAGWRLALAGAPAGFGAAEELAAAEASSRRADIDVLGYVSQEQLNDLYGRAGIFAFPSLDEGFGMPLLDAMAWGVPAVASARSAMPEVAGDAALLVDPEDEDALTSALARLAEDESLRREMAGRGVARAREFSWASAVERTWAVYGELR